MKYAPKYAPERPAPWALLTPRVVWKWAFLLKVSRWTVSNVRFKTYKTSSNPYAKPHRKNSVVTRQIGMIDCLVVI